MPRYEAYLPAFCTVKVVLETEDPITDPVVLRDTILVDGECSVVLCHTCNDDIEFDGQLDEEVARKIGFTVEVDGKHSLTLPGMESHESDS